MYERKYLIELTLTNRIDPAKEKYFQIELENLKIPLESSHI